ncbi:MAG: glycoside hydrolase [Bacteroidota bacterium]|nr:glycoside hydrolase [Bacteroidota bacterium]
MKVITFIAFFSILTSSAFAQTISNPTKDAIVAKGTMPNMVTDKSNNVYIVYGTGDSIMYLSSTNKAKSFTSPSLIAVLPGLFASAMRGPQIAATDNGLIITACTNKGNIYSYKQLASGKWSTAMKVNDVDEVAKEALMGLSADGLNVFAVWLAVKSPKGQNVYGAKSVDGGKTWSKNLLVYASPESTVCECCKPSVAVKGNNVYVMFRNFLNGNRDLYVAKSVNGGKSFEAAEKLGVGNWKLNGCPMDGGGLAINKSGIPQTVWRREGKIYASTVGSTEKEIGEGRGCTIETVNNKNVYAWTENGDVVVIKPQGQKKVLGKGSQPIVKALNDEHVICVWENDKQIHASVLDL